MQCCAIARAVTFSFEPRAQVAAPGVDVADAPADAEPDEVERHHRRRSGIVERHGRDRATRRYRSDRDVHAREQPGLTVHEHIVVEPGAVPSNAQASWASRIMRAASAGSETAKIGVAVGPRNLVRADMQRVDVLDERARALLARHAGTDDADSRADARAPTASVRTTDRAIRMPAPRGPVAFRRRATTYTMEPTRGPTRGRGRSWPEDLGYPQNPSAPSRSGRRRRRHPGACDVLLVEGIIPGSRALAILLPPFATLRGSPSSSAGSSCQRLIGWVTTLGARGARVLVVAVSALLATVAGLSADPAGAAAHLAHAAADRVLRDRRRGLDPCTLEHRQELSGRWEWMLVSGVIDLALAGIIFAGLPGTAAWALGIWSAST
jgi:hypothetical protein